MSIQEQTVVRIDTTPAHSRLSDQILSDLQSLARLEQARSNGHSALDQAIAAFEHKIELETRILGVFAPS